MVGHARFDAGSFVPTAVAPSLSGSVLSPQKIRQVESTGPGLHAQVPDSPVPMIAKDLQSLEIPGGFSVAAAAVATGMEQSSPIFTSEYIDCSESSKSDSEFFDVSNGANICDIGLPKASNEDMMDIAMMNTTNDHGVGTQGVMGIASSSKPNGESSTFLSPSCSLSLIENDTETHFISTEEVIAFGGIPKPSAMLRSSNRLSGQSNADMPIMEKAMENAQLHDDYFNSGKLATPKYSIVNIADVDIVKRAEKLGVSLGASQAEIDQSIRGIKLVEEERILTILKKNENDRE
jgi:hypothetical protein